MACRPTLWLKMETIPLQCQPWARWTERGWHTVWCAPSHPPKAEGFLAAWGFLMASTATTKGLANLVAGTWLVPGWGQGAAIRGKAAATAALLAPGPSASSPLEEQADVPPCLPPHSCLSAGRDLVAVTWSSTMGSHRRFTPASRLVRWPFLHTCPGTGRDARASTPSGTTWHVSNGSLCSSADHFSERRTMSPLGIDWGGCSAVSPAAPTLWAGSRPSAFQRRCMHFQPSHGPKRTHADLTTLY